jgi:hypothetical protein
MVDGGRRMSDAEDWGGQWLAGTPAEGLWRPKASFKEADAKI